MSKVASDSCCSPLRELVQQGAITVVAPAAEVEPVLYGYLRAGVTGAVRRHVEVAGNHNELNEDLGLVSAMCNPIPRTDCVASLDTCCVRYIDSYSPQK